MLGAIVLYIVGRWLISLAISVILNITLLIAILGYFRVQTTSFAALLAGAGLAIGSAWGGLLPNFAAGVFLVVLRPFKAGDFISAGGITGTVEEVGLFVTTVDTPDNIRNFSTNPCRRVEISGAADPKQVINAPKQRIRQIPNVTVNPEPDVVIPSFIPAGPVLAIRPCTNNQHYRQVYFDTNLAIREVLGDGAFPAPVPVFGIHQVSEMAARA